MRKAGNYVGVVVQVVDSNEFEPRRPKAKFIKKEDNMTWTNQQDQDFHALLKQYVAEDTRAQLKELQDKDLPIEDHVLNPIAEQAFATLINDNKLIETIHECIDTCITAHFNMKGEE